MVRGTYVGADDGADLVSFRHGCSCRFGKRDPMFSGMLPRADNSSAMTFSRGCEIEGLENYTFAIGNCTTAHYQ